MKIAILFILPFLLTAQGKRDYIWLLGGNRTFTTDSNFQGFQLDFNSKPLSIYVKDRPTPIIRQNNASICDRSGNLLMYTAGCNISDRLFRPMPNGKINQGEAWDFSCKYGDYSCANCTLFLPNTFDSNKYFLLHKFDEFDPDSSLPGTTSTKLLYSIIDLRQNNGYGDLTSKNQLILQKNISGSDLTATKHANNLDWWILVPGRANDLYFSIQMTEAGPMPFKEMKLGIPMEYLDDGGSQSCFSPDGTKYARMTPSNGLFLMDFNRTSGVISNFLNVTTGSETNDHSVGVSFSPNSRFVYLVYRFDIYQADTWATDLNSSLVHIDKWDGYVDEGIWAAGFDAAMLGPDCKIYIRTGTSNRVMHVIHSPNEKGKACNFEQHGIHLPAWNHASIPNFVNYRLGYEPVCDSSMTMTWNNFASEESIVCYPNPVEERVNVELLNRDKLIQSISVLDMTGRLILQQNYYSTNFKEFLELKDLSSGIYLVVLRDKEEKEYIAKVIKQ